MGYSFNTTGNQSLPGRVFLGEFFVALIVIALYAPLLLNHLNLKRV
jgi:hypothetical protein